MKRPGLVAVFFLALLPFVRRPWLFDDPSVIVTARRAAQNPWRPYDYSMDLGSPDRPIWLPGEGPAYTHPPLSAWILGGAIKLAGEREWALHLAVWVFALALVAFAGNIAEAMGVDGLAGYLFAFSPVVFLSSLTLYPHVFYLTFYLLSLWLALRDNVKPRVATLAWIGISLTLAFFSLDHWPVLILLIGILLGRRCIFPLGLFFLLAGGWTLWEIHCYGSSHFWSNLHWRGGGTYPMRAAFLPSVFIAGGLPMIAVAWPYVLSRSKIVFGGLSALALATWTIFFGPRGGFTVFQGGLLALELATGLAFLASLAWLWKEDSDFAGRRIIGWFLVEFLFLQRFLVYPSGHHLLMLALPATLLSVRIARDLGWPEKYRRGGVAALAAFTLVLAVADLQEAAIGPRLARDLSGLSGPRYYWGNDFSGFCYYLKAEGWRAYDARMPLKTGDVIVVPLNWNVQGPPLFLKKPGLRLVSVRRYAVKVPLRTFSLGDAAGWYSASWGALPYTFSTAPAEMFFIYSQP